MPKIHKMLFFSYKSNQLLLFYLVRNNSIITTSTLQIHDFSWIQCLIILSLFVLFSTVQKH